MPKNRGNENKKMEKRKEKKADKKVVKKTLKKTEEKAPEKKTPEKEAPEKKTPEKNTEKGREQSREKPIEKKSKTTESKNGNQDQTKNSVELEYFENKAKRLQDDITKMHKNNKKLLGDVKMGEAKVAMLERLLSEERERTKACVECEIRKRREAEIPERYASGWYPRGGFSYRGRYTTSRYRPYSHRYYYQ